MMAVLAGFAAWNDELIVLRRRAVVNPLDLIDLVGAKPPLAGAAVHHRIGEMIQMTARLPHSRMHDDRGIESDHVLPTVHVVAPPDALPVVLELYAKRAIVPARTGAAVNFARLKNESAPLAKRHDGFHLDH